MTDYKKMAELIFGNELKTPEYYEELYPQRNLQEGQRVTRLAPSPTGFLHFGVLFTCLINRRVADASNGVFYVRIEDTDQKREVEGGIADIVNGLINFGIKIDEGFVGAEETAGIYGPYKQSERTAIYHTYVKYLMELGYAYPCFCTEKTLEENRVKQNAEKLRTGYYGEFASCRNLSFDEVKSNIDAGIPYVIRLRSPGSETNRIVFDDMIKGKIEMPENDEDFVLLKSDGIPTYHFAHAVDDHLMRTTHVIRGDEWISSVPKHIQLFKLLGFKAPKYAHVSPIMKEDGSSKRKLSKRKDPEAAVRFYAQQGYPVEAVTDYMLTVANSDFEDWRRANATADNSQFKLNLKKMSVSGALFDLAKLNDISKNVVSKMSSDTVMGYILDWASEFDKEFYDVLSADKNYLKQIVSIDRDVPKPRKDIAKWSDFKDYTVYFFDGFNNDYPLPEHLDKADAVKILTAYKDVYSADDDRTEWFDKIKSICPEANFCPEVKEYKKNPAIYNGHSGDAATIIRVAITGRTNSPDLCEIMKVLGKDTVINRIDDAIKALNEVL